MRVSDRKTSVLVLLGAVALVCGLLYWGKPVLMPLALAVLLAFLLNPLVNWLQHHGLSRPPSVLVVVVVVISLITGIGMAMAAQFVGLANDLPLYKDNVRQKVMQLKSAGKGTPVEKIQETIKEMAGEIKKEEEAIKAREESAAPYPGPDPDEEEEEEEPVPVVVRGDSPISSLLPSLGPTLASLATAGLVVVMVIFILLRLHELRNRLIRLVGYSRLTTTTKALDEAAERISSYLLMQFAINATYGLALGIALYFLGMPHVVLWGFLAAVARFIPYVGPWLGALLPTAMALGVFEGWMMPLAVVGCIVVLELTTNMILEPLLYSHSAGVNEVGVIMALAFWTWLWGPVGLILATPLTVCLVVLSKHIPQFAFLDMLLGDEVVMEQRLVFYQRLLAMDRAEANDIMTASLKSRPPKAVFDELFIPALSFAKQDYAQGRLDDGDNEFILATLSELMGQLKIEGRDPETNHHLEKVTIAQRPKLRILCLPASDEADELALRMLARLLESTRCELVIASAASLASEMIAMVSPEKPHLVCIGSLEPEPLPSARYLCKRLRSRYPDLRIVAGRWPFSGDVKEVREQLRSAGADYVGTSLLESRNQILQMMQIISEARQQSNRASRTVTPVA